MYAGRLSSRTVLSPLKKSLPLSNRLSTYLPFTNMRPSGFISTPGSCAMSPSSIEPSWSWKALALKTSVSFLV